MIVIESIPTSRLWFVLFQIAWSITLLVDDLVDLPLDKDCWLDKLCDYCESRSGYGLWDTP